MTPDQLTRLEGPAKNFIQATLDEGAGFCAIRFENAVVVVAHNSAPGSAEFLAAVQKLIGANADTSAIGDMKL